MPARVQQAVREENLRFLKSRDVYCPDYYEFIYELCQVKSYVLNTFQTVFFICFLLKKNRPMHLKK